MAAMLMFWRAPPLKMFRNPRTVLLSKICERAAGLVPGTGRFATKRKITSMAKVNSIFARMSGWNSAL